MNIHLDRIWRLFLAMGLLVIILVYALNRQIDKNQALTEQIRAFQEAQRVPQTLGIRKEIKQTIKLR